MENITKTSEVPEEIMSLHRYFIHANKMRVLFDEVLERNKNSETKEFQIESTMYMSIWYGLLYTVIEGWRRLALSDEQINNLLLQKDNIDLLWLYRNGTFHYQKEYYSDKCRGFCETD